MLNIKTAYEKYFLSLVFYILSLLWLLPHKQREDVLLSEMDATGQAFEDMQEQNTRLLERVREKDDANLKLMTEVGEETVSSLCVWITLKPPKANNNSWHWFVS